MQDTNDKQLKKNDNAASKTPHNAFRDARLGKIVQRRFQADDGFVSSNNIYPSLFHSWPIRPGRIGKTVRALKRIKKRQNACPPNRKDFASTAEFYEAALPYLKTNHALGKHPKDLSSVPSLSILFALKKLKNRRYF